MEYILKFKDLEKYFKKADFTDVKVFEGNTTLRRFITTVYYKHWTGPVYFNLIRPFHHLVVSRMAQYDVAPKKWTLS